MDEIPKFLQLGGGWGIVSGPGLLMFRTISSGIISSVLLGMTGASIAATIYDTASVPFLVSASFGFVFGVASFYRDALRKSLQALDRYPRLLQLHLNANFSHRGFDLWTLDQLRSETFPRNWQMKSMLMAAWTTALPAIERIKESREDGLIASYGQNSQEQEQEQ